MSDEPNAPVPVDTADDGPTARLKVMWGAAGLERLRAARVVVLGCGGVGSNCIEALARGGVGALAVVDGDAVAASNINRQAIAYRSTVGKRKVEVVRAMIHEIDPAIRVVPFDQFLLAEDVPQTLAQAREALGGAIDYVIDAIDTTSTKLALAQWADKTGTPLIASMGGAMKTDPFALTICDIYATQGDALARVMRKECRRRGIRRLTVLSSSEPGRAPAPDAPRDEHGRPVLGTASYLPPIMGQMIAGHVIRALVDAR